jgi:hypothetical protein
MNWKKLQNTKYKSQTNSKLQTALTGLKIPFVDRIGIFILCGSLAHAPSPGDE